MSAAVPDFLHDVRAMTMADIDVVAAIEAKAYEFPWSENIFRDCLRGGYSGIVFERYGAVFAYGMLSVAVGEAHILNLCVDPELQGKGYGNTMLDVLISKARELGAEQMYLEVRPSNHSAQYLYHRAGFNEVGLRKNYYRSAKGREDAIVFAKELNY